MRYCTGTLPEGSIKYTESEFFISGWTIDSVQPDEIINYFNKSRAVSLQQTHSAIIFNASDIESTSEGDGIILNEKSPVSFIRTADCVPLFFWSDKERYAGILHSGWRSFQKGIATNLIKNHFNKDFDINSFTFVAGPSISGTCYEVGPEVKEAFKNRKDTDQFCIPRKNGKYRLDIKLGLKYELMSLGVNEDQIFTSDICTHCTDGYHSYRQNKTNARIQNFILYK